MNTTENSCDQSAIDAFLVDQLDAAQCENLESHLESCEPCRDSLHSQAASDDVWAQTQQFLVDDPNDLDLLSDQSVGDAHLKTGMRDYRTLIDALAPTDDPRMIGRLSRFEIAGIIGSGGMGIVLKAFDPALSRFVALKVLATDLWENKIARQRFSREARATASVVHENVVEIYSVATDGQIPYYAMPYLRGETLSQRIQRQGPLEVDEILRISKQLADGIAAAHQQGLVHRDLKPANVFLTHGAERVHVTDFGLAHVDGEDHLTKTGFLAGTPAFMSPEQIKGEPLDARSDLFSLGSVMYTMCAGQTPFQADTTIQTIKMICDQSARRLEHLNPSIPMWLAAIVDRLHARSPSDRYQTAEELAADLNGCLAHKQNPDSCIQPRGILRLQNRYERTGCPAKLSRRAASIACVAAIALLIGAGLWALLRGGASAQTGESAGGANEIAVEGRVVNSRNKPLAGATVLAVQKIWPNNRYQQHPLETQTDAMGKFRFDRFAIAGKQYAFLLTALADGHSMTSVYQFVKDGRKQKPVTLKVQPSQATRIRVVDGNGKPIRGVKVLPSSRKTTAGQEYMTYAMQVTGAGKPTDKNGIVSLDAFQASDEASVTIEANGEISDHSITIAGNGTSIITLASASKGKTSGPVTIQGKVMDTSGKAVPDAKVIVVRKSWPGGRFRMDSLQGKTDTKGEFRFEKFVSGNIKYEFMLTVIEGGFAMTSEYRGMDNKGQADPVMLKLEPADPVTFNVTDASGNPVAGAVLSPKQRQTGRKVPHMNYPINRKAVSYKTDSSGKATLTAWKPGESGELFYEWKGKVGE